MRRTLLGWVAGCDGCAGSYLCGPWRVEALQTPLNIIHLLAFGSIAVRNHGHTHVNREMVNEVNSYGLRVAPVSHKLLRHRFVIVRSNTVVIEAHLRLSFPVFNEC